MTTATVPSRSGAVRKRWPWILAGLLFIGGIGGSILVAKNRSSPADSVALSSTSPVTRGTIRVSVSGPGTLEANATRTVGADLTATVGAVPAMGEKVTKGQLITTLKSDTVNDNVQTAQLNLQKAQANLDSTRASQNSSAAQRSSSVVQAQGTLTQASQTLTDAQRTLNGQKQLYAIGAVSTQALSEAQAAVDKAQLTLDSARSSLSSAQTQSSTGNSSDTQTIRSAQIAVEQAQASLETALKAKAKLKVYAPINGVINTVSATEGTVVTSGSTILTILDATTLNLPVQVDETEIAGVKVGQQAEVTLDAFDGQTFGGKVVRVSPSATQSSGISVFTATVQLKNADGQLRSGMTAEAEIIQSEDSGLLVPNKAISSVRTRSYVEVPAEPARAEPERVRVELGATDGTNTIISSGLTEGQEVIVEGAKKATSTNNSGGSGNSGSSSSSGRTQNPGGFGGGMGP